MQSSAIQKSNQALLQSVSSTPTILAGRIYGAMTKNADGFFKELKKNLLLVNSKQCYQYEQSCWLYFYYLKIIGQTPDRGLWNKPRPCVFFHLR